MMNTEVLPNAQPVEKDTLSDADWFAQGYENCRGKMLEILRNFSVPPPGSYGDGFHNFWIASFNFHEGLQPAPVPRSGEKRAKPNMAKMIQADIEPRRVAELRELFASEQKTS